MPDADVPSVAAALAASGYSNAGQACISAQRVLVHNSCYDDVVDATTEAVARLSVGDPLEASTDVASLISQAAATRVESSIREALDMGARATVGGDRQGAVVAPAVLADVAGNARIMTDELFGPAVALCRFTDVSEAIAVANEGEYGLAAAVFTESLDSAMTFAREIEAGSVMVNGGPLWREDFAPHGGVKSSGLGKEDPRDVIADLTETKTVVFHRLSQWP
jgi:glyceraldehyde-3-phosphate dehydrogenase (NADP+)